MSIRGIILRAQLLISLAILAIFAQPGVCDNQISDQELKAIMIDSSESQNTYRFTTDLKEELQIGNITQGANYTENIQVNSFTEGEANYTSRKMREATLTTMEYGSNKSEPEETEIYIENDTAYIRFNGNWTKMTFGSPEALWHSQKTINQQLDLLNQSRIELVGSEVLDGQDCYQIRVTPNMSAYAAIVSQPLGSLTPLLPVNLTNLYKNSTAVWTNWITKEGHVLKKSYLEMNFTMTPDVLGIDENESTYKIAAKANATILYSDYNQPVEIVIPEEAYDAAEILMPSENMSRLENASQLESAPQYENLPVQENLSEQENQSLIETSEAKAMTDAAAFQTRKFPISGGNEHGNATVFGSTETIAQDAGQKLVMADMAMTDMKLPVEVFLVDFDNNYYRGDLSWKEVGLPANLGQRILYVFQLPSGSDVEKIAITPPGGEPFYIDWVTTPVASSDNLTIRFLKLDDSGYSTGWRAAVEASNNGTDAVELNKSDFALEDQFGWEYALDFMAAAGQYDPASKVEIGPGEKAYVILGSKDVSPFSWPAAIIYRPYGMRIDISCWT